LSFAAGAAVLAALFGLAQRAVGSGLAALATIACATLPLFRALVAQMNMDILVAAFTLLALLALSRRQEGRAVTWAAFALFVKPTGIIIVVALAVMLVLRRVRPAWFALSAAERPRITLALWLLGGLCLLFAAELAFAAHHGKLPPGVSLFGGALPFLGKRLWTLPEFGLLLLALVLVAPGIVRRAQRGEAHALEIDGLVFAAAFVGFYCQYQNVLPRYCAQAFPIVLLALVAAASARLSRKAVGVALAAFAGVMAAPIYNVSPQMGAELIIVVFAVVVIGGMGSILGAIVTGFGLGVIEGLTKVFFPEASNTVIFVIMAIVLLVRPAGLFGRRA